MEAAILTHFLQCIKPFWTCGQTLDRVLVTRSTLSTVACFQLATLLKNKLFKGFHYRCSVAIN